MTRITNAQWEKISLAKKPALIAAVITERQGKVDVCPIAFHVISTKWEKPFVACVGLANRGYTLSLITRTKRFVLAYPSHAQLKDILWCGTVTGRKVNKARLTRLKFIQSKHGLPFLMGAVANIGCRLIKKIRLNTFTLVVGEAIDCHALPSRALQKVYTLGNEQYGVLKGWKVNQKGRT